MIEVYFKKIQATGNDFVMLDNMTGRYDNLSLDQIRLLCKSKFGIGADGLIMLNQKDLYDFEVDYYNSDGSKSFCGNGARAATLFARDLGIITSEATFYAIDGEHSASIDGNIVSLRMNAVKQIEERGSVSILHTGSPHYIEFDSEHKSIVPFGQSVRYADEFKEQGINVNLVKESADGLEITTYERGVENETLSCGTGVTAAALAWMKRKGLDSGEVLLSTKGGDLRVKANYVDGKFDDVYLIGPAQVVFEGKMVIE